MITTAHPLHVLVDQGDGRAPVYRLEVGATAAVVGCGPAGGRGPFGPAVAAVVVEPAQPSRPTRIVRFAVTPADEPPALPGWAATGIGLVDGHRVCEVVEDPTWSPAVA